jgi:hypothetical protein
MRSFSWVPFSLLCLILTCVIICAGQSEDGVRGHVFRSDALRLTYTFSEKLAPMVESEMPPTFRSDPNGREDLILALWDTPERTGTPRMAFLYDKNVRQAGLSRAQMADNYLNAIKQMWVSVPGVKIVGPKQISPAGYSIWRLDLRQPDDRPHYNSAVVIPLADRRLLVIRVSAPSQSELDTEVDSLSALHFDRK